MMPTFDFVNIIRATLRGILGTVGSPVAIVTALATVFGGVMALLASFGISQFMAHVDFDFQLPSDSVGLVDLALYTVNPPQLLRVGSLMLKAVPAFFVFAASAATALAAGLWVYRFAFASRSAVKEQVV